MIRTSVRIVFGGGYIGLVVKGYIGPRCQLGGVVQRVPVAHRLQPRQAECAGARARARRRARARARACARQPLQLLHHARRAFSRVGSHVEVQVAALLEPPSTHRALERLDIGMSAHVLS